MIPGRVVDDKYRIRRVIGRGGMSVVVEADHLLLGHRVAIKFLRTDVARALAAEPRFFREARLAARLMSNHTCRVSDVGIWESGPYLVLELLDGRTLNQELRERKTIPIAEACEIVMQACDALAEAHALGIVHRDVKPGNFFLCANTANHVHAKVLDFGVAKIPAAVVTRNGEGSLTDGNTLIGTPSYISPEQLQNSKVVDARADIWGLGVVLYEMLAGYPPFRDAWVPRMLVKIAREPHVPIREIRPNIPAVVDHVIERCLSKNPSDRYSSAGDLGLALAGMAPPSEEILERLMAFGTSVPRLATFSSGPPNPDRILDIIEPEFAHNNSLDPYTTSVKHLRRKRRMPPALVAAMGGVLCGGIVAAAWIRHDMHSEDSQAARAERDNRASAAVSATKPANVEQQDIAHIELFATPAQTQWSLDGIVLGSTPHIGQQPRDNRTHTLVAQAPGYEPRSLTVYLDRDLSLSLALDRKVCPTTNSPPIAPQPPRQNREPRGRSLDNLNPYSNGND
jgi:serine/threonine-protein kinase